MKVVAILIIILLLAFTIWQGYSLVKKLIERKKCKGTEISQADSTQEESEINNEEEK